MASANAATAIIVFFILFVIIRFISDTVFGVLDVSIAYKAISVPHRKYRGTRRERRRKSNKSGKMIRIH